MSKRRPPRLSLDFLRAFDAAARHLSFTRAAQELLLTQPAINRGIKTLEQQLGQPLLHRTIDRTRSGVLSPFTRANESGHCDHQSASATQGLTP